MTVNEIIIKALEPFGIPVKPDFYNGPEPKYFTFNYADDRGADYGDNMPLSAVVYMQIHYFCPMTEDYLYAKKKIRKALFNAGFTYPSVTDATIAEDEIRHLVFECDIENGYELLED